jgi:dATP pyrophosphohydrolase
MPHKVPVSVLVVLHTPALEVLLLERVAHPGYWQSVTGSLDSPEESLEAAAVRELNEETGIETVPGRLRNWHLSNRFEIFMQWRHRYAPGIFENTEHVFSLELPSPVSVRLAPEEHCAQLWLPWREAADKCFSWSNRDAIRMLGEGRIPE